jgi:hypothetical protein
LVLKPVPEVSRDMYTQEKIDQSARRKAGTEILMWLLEQFSTRQTTNFIPICACTESTDIILYAFQKNMG